MMMLMNIIPIYIQKEIIKLLCFQVNRINKKLCEFDLQENEENEYKNINSNILSISKVNWCWFNTVSNYLSVSNDYNNFLKYSVNGNGSGYGNKYSLLKNENITTLRLESSNINLEKLNKSIKESNLPNLKKILINITIINNKSTSNNQISMIGKIEFPAIRISNFEFDASTNSSTSLSIPSNIKKIKSIGFLKNYSPWMIVSNLKNLSFKELYICNYNNKFPFKELSTLNKLSSIQYYDTHKTPIKIEDLYYMLKSSPNLKLLAIHICLDDLIYQLSCSKHKTKQCSCSTNSGSIATSSNEIFLNYWKLVCGLIKKHKNLKSLFIYPLCKNNNNNNSNNTVTTTPTTTATTIITNNGNANIIRIGNNNNNGSNNGNNNNGTNLVETNNCGLNYLNKQKFSNHFISQFGSMISKNKSIKKLSIDGFHTPQLLQWIIGNNNTIQSIQASFSNIQNNNNNFSISNSKKIEYIETVNQLLTNPNSFHQIKKFKFIENFVNNDHTSLKTENVLYTFENK